MAGVNEDNFLWIMIYHAVPNYVTFRLDLSALSQAQWAIFSDVPTRINPHLVIMEGKAKQWWREAFHSSQSCCCCPVCLHIRCGSRWTMTYLSARFPGAGGLPCCPRKMKFLTGLFVLSFLCASTIPALVIQESLSMLSC